MVCSENVNDHSASPVCKYEHQTRSWGIQSVREFWLANWCYKKWRRVLRYYTDLAEWKWRSSFPMWSPHFLTGVYKEAEKQGIIQPQFQLVPYQHSWKREMIELRKYFSGNPKIKTHFKKWDKLRNVKAFNAVDASFEWLASFKSKPFKRSIYCIIGCCFSTDMGEVSSGNRTEWFWVQEGYQINVFHGTDGNEPCNRWLCPG